MRSFGRPTPAGCLLGATAAAAAGLTVASWRAEDTGATVVEAGLTLAIAAFGLSTVRLLHEIKEQQHRIIEQLETQTRLLHNAARLARADDTR